MQATLGILEKYIELICCQRSVRCNICYPPKTYLFLGLARHIVKQFVSLAEAPVRQHVYDRRYESI